MTFNAIKFQKSYIRLSNKSLGWDNEKVADPITFCLRQWSSEYWKLKVHKC